MRYLIVVFVLSLLFVGCEKDYASYVTAEQLQDPEYKDGIVMLEEEARYFGCITGCLSVYEKLNYTGLDIPEEYNPYLIAKEECEGVCD